MSTRAQLDEQILDLIQQFIASAVMTNERIARTLGLNVVDLQALGVITRHGEPIAAGEVAELTALPTSTTTRVLDRLERTGFVERAPDPRDRRRVVIQTVPGALSPESSVAESDPYAQVVADTLRVHRDFTAEELQIVARYFERTLQKHSGAPDPIVEREPPVD